VLLLALGIVFPVAVLVAGLVLLILSSDKAVEHSVFFASALGFSPLIIGLVLVSIGTDLPEIYNSIVSCWSGHGDINLGDSFGSILSQITLVLGIIAVLGRGFKVKRREVLVIGAFEVLALTLSLSVAVTGFTRVKAFLLIATWPFFIFVIRKLLAKDITSKKRVRRQKEMHYLWHLVVAVLGFVGVAIGAIAVVQSVITLSQELGIPEFFISFFAVGIGTSIPELVVDVTAIRKREYELAIGDIIGSCIVDATVSISIGQLLFPTAVFVSGYQHSLPLVLYAIFASTIVIFILAARKKVDKKAGILFILLYLASFSLPFLV
jgi:cation:H+ antiporter